MEIDRGDGVEISDDPARLDLDRVHHWLSTDAYWAMGRSREVFERSIEGSVVYGLYADGTQVGFARVVTDRATFAWLCDVYVDRPARGTGLGLWFVSAVCDDVKGRGLRRIVLATQDAHGLYAKLGFTGMTEPERWMELRITP